MSKPYQCPDKIHEKLEAEAVKRRKTTGENVIWSKVLTEILKNHFGLKSTK